MLFFILIISSLICVIIAGFFSGAETAFVSIDKAVLHSLTSKNNRSAVLAEKILSSPAKMLATTLIGTNLFYVSATTLATLAVSFFASQQWQSVITTAIMTPLILVCAELVPKSIGRNSALAYVLAAAPVVFIAQKILQPFVAMISFLSSGALKLFGIKDSHNKFSITREEVRTLAEISEEHGLIGKTEKKMINRVFELNTATLASVMVPLVELTTVPLDAEIDEVLDIAQQTGHYKIPVFEEKNHNIIGIVFANDLLDAQLNCESDGDKLILANLVDKSVPFMPETKLIGSALKELRENNSEIIFVIDEYGGVTGMITIHDIAEEIAGEVAAEADDDKPFIAFHKKGVDCEGRFDIDELGELFNVKFDKDGYETIAGLILKLAGRVPARGETFNYKNLKLTVLRSDKKKIYRVRISPLDTAIQ